MIYSKLNVIINDYCINIFVMYVIYLRRKNMENEIAPALQENNNNRANAERFAELVERYTR